VVAALCISPVLALAQTPARSIPAGTHVDFIADESINIDTVRPGGSFRMHLAQPLVLDGTSLALAGTPSRLMVADKFRTAGGTVMLALALENLKLRAGELPLIAVPADVAGVTLGMTITAVTLGSVERSGDRIVIRVPVPMALSSSQPNAAYTALPAATAGPFVPPPRRGATPTPLPTTFNPPDPSASPDAAAAATPGASASP
jgi:hypothetical protein